MPSLEETGIFDGAYDDEDVETAMVSYISKQRRTNHKDYQNCLFTCFLSQQKPKKVIQALTDSSWIKAMQKELLQFKHQKVWTLVDLPKGKRAIGTKWVYRNKKDERGIIVRNKARLVAQGYTQEEGINYDEVFAHVARIEAIRNGFIWDAIKALEPGMRPCLPTYWKIDLKEVYVDDIIFGSTKKSLCVEFGGIMTIQIQDEFYRGAHFLLRIATSTPIETNKALIKDEKAKDVDVHLYRSMIRSLMYLTASRPDIMFVVCACVRFQVTPKVSHLHVVKRIFRYLKCQPKLGLWYPRDSPFDLESFSDSDYVRASLDRKSITGVALIEGRMITMDWRCFLDEIKDRQNSMVEFGEMRQLEVLRYAFTKNPIIYVSLIKKFWHTATVRTVDNGEQEINVTVDGKEFTITEASVMRHLQFAELLHDEESVKKQKLKENDAEKEELRACLDIVSGDEIAMDFESLATKYPIIDWKTHILTENMICGRATQTSILEWAVDKNGRLRIKGTSSSSGTIRCILGFGIRRIDPDLAETMIWYILKRTFVELIRAF
ncbi:ribonuclease H-like domain, reverse transcriptase, RNA-dependent DNA polymerase [Tanacetum coccineum]